MQYYFFFFFFFYMTAVSRFRFAPFPFVLLNYFTLISFPY